MTILKNFLLVSIFLIALIFYMRLIERRALFNPFKKVEQTPAMAGMSYEDVRIKTSDGVTIAGWFIPRPGSDAVVYFFHGNSGNLSHRIEKVRFFNQLGYDVFILDYRGYGDSQGEPSEEGVYRDAQAGYAYLTRGRRIDPERIVVYGESLGGAVAVDLASKSRIGALVLEGTFSSESDMTRRLLPFLPAPLLQFKFDSYSKIDRIGCPKFFIHSKNDEIVPYDLAQKLYGRARSPKEFITVQGGHNDAFFVYESEIALKLRPFLAAAMAKKPVLAHAV